MKKIKNLGVMLDCSRDAVYSVDALTNYFEVLSKMGYTFVQLYTEDVFEMEGEPFFGYMRGRYTKEELKKLDAIAASYGIELMPCVQTLAHLGGICRWEAYGEIIDVNDILLADDDRTYALVEKIFATCAECFTSRRINIGMDEAHMVGLGRYLDKHGYTNRVDILLKHLNRVSEIADKYGFKPMMWSDMFFRLANHGEYAPPKEAFPKEVIDLVPENIQLVYWDYYSTEKAHYDGMIAAHKQFKNKTLFGGGAWCWHGFAPNNLYSIKATREAMAACIEGGIDEVFITCWKDDGAESSLYSNLPALACAAEFAKGNFDMETIKRKFKRVVGVDFDAFMALDYGNPTVTENSIINPCKYMLYSDLFMGLMDLSTVGKTGEEYAEAKKKLSVGARTKKYGYVFKTLAALCDVLEIKYTLGRRTREAYEKGDKEELLALAKEYGEVVKRLEKFYDAFLCQWTAEAKPFGFEKHDIRLGGLMRRVKHCQKELLAYCAGKISSISQLEEKIILPYASMKEGEDSGFGNWALTTMIKPNM